MRGWGYVEPIPARRVTYKDHNTNIQACKNNNKLVYGVCKDGARGTRGNRRIVFLGGENPESLVKEEEKIAARREVSTG